ncbi:MAG: hypothetical protein KF845_02800 [Cyclobacteriaceae bacterium]|nr:hypothetical protein [Cyclobacteriaceae bacterium]
MFIPFNTLPDSARLWIYQSDRAFTPEEERAISATLQAFVNEWHAHNQPLKTSFQVLHNYFIVLAVDEAQYEASGCSIDSSVRIIRQLGEQTGINFFERTNVAVMLDEGIRLLKLPELKQAHENGAWNANTTVFDNSVLTKGDFEKRWRSPAGETWLKRYLSVAPV